MMNCFQILLSNQNSAPTARAGAYLLYIVFNCALLMLQSDVPRAFAVHRTLQNALKFGGGGQALLAYFTSSAIYPFQLNLHNWSN